jgi:hypothetical protein
VSLAVWKLRKRSADHCFLVCSQDATEVCELATGALAMPLEVVNDHSFE